MELQFQIKFGWLEKNPFEMFKLRMQKAECGYLTPTELFEIENKEIDIPRIRFARDLFIFQSYKKKYLNK